MLSVHLRAHNTCLYLYLKVKHTKYESIINTSNKCVKGQTNSGVHAVQFISSSFDRLHGDFTNTMHLTDTSKERLKELANPISNSNCTLPHVHTHYKTSIPGFL